jgi:hypothetical protein
MANPLTDDHAWRQEVLLTLQALLAVQTGLVAEHRALVEQLRTVAALLRALPLGRSRGREES